jgi:hypothetical protein
MEERAIIESDVHRTLYEAVSKSYGSALAKPPLQY